MTLPYVQKLLLQGVLQNESSGNHKELPVDTTVDLISNKVVVLWKGYHQDCSYCGILQTTFIKEIWVATSYKTLLSKLKKIKMFFSGLPLRRLALKKVLSSMFYVGKNESEFS